MVDDVYYSELQAVIADFCRESLSLVNRRVVESDSPLRAFCIEYDDDGAFNLRMETQKEWIRRDAQSATYKIRKGRAWLDLCRDDVIAGIRAGRFGSETICRRSLYREFQVSRFFPEEFGLAGPSAHDWTWEYAAGEFDIAATATTELFDLLERYWIDVMEHKPRIRSALEGTTRGEGESYTYLRRHIDKEFVRAVSGAIRGNQGAISSISCSQDFIAFISIAESDFNPDLVMLGDGRRFRRP